MFCGVHGARVWSHASGAMGTSCRDRLQLECCLFVVTKELESVHDMYMGLAKCSLQFLSLHYITSCYSIPLQVRTHIHITHTHSLSSTHITCTNSLLCTHITCTHSLLCTHITHTLTFIHTHHLYTLTFVYTHHMYSLTFVYTHHTYTCTSCTFVCTHTSTGYIILTLYILAEQCCIRDQVPYSCGRVGVWCHGHAALLCSTSL